MEERSLARRLRRLRPERAQASGPLVSIVVANRDGEHHLRRFLNGLDERTSYRSFELIVVDNASSDGSLDLVRQWPGSCRILENSSNKSFSETNNQGIRAAAGDLVLLANNDIDPIHPEWLGYMVESLGDDTAAVGAMLVYPRRRRREQPPQFPDLTVQHLGVAFQRSKWGVRAANTAIGTDPLLFDPPSRRDVPAATAACLLARRVDLLETPLDEAFWYGSEDWDLCLRLAQRGKIVVDERAVLFHHEYGTQDSHMSDEWLVARTHNHHHFNDLWGPSLLRKLRIEACQPRSEYFFRDQTTPRALIISSPRRNETAKRLHREVATAGWHLTDKENRGADIAIACNVPQNAYHFAGHDRSVAVVLDRHEEWARSGALDAAKQIVVPDRVGQARLDAAWGRDIAQIEEGLQSGGADLFSSLLQGSAPRPTQMRIGVATAAPTWEKAQFYGDTFLARGLMRAFRRLGHEATELTQPDWRSARAASCDVVIHLRGLRRRPTARGQWNVLWIISHPDRVEADEYDDYDVIACASHRHAERLSRELGRVVHFLPQATDGDTFHIGPRDVDFEAPVLYVGIARWPNRRAPRWMTQNGRRFHLYGRNWDDFPEGKFVRGDYIDNRDLATAYRSAAVVVADHHGSMRTEGFAANRLFDVLASGGLVLSDDVAGLTELFDDAVPTYSNAQELESQLRVLLADKALRRRLAAAGREIVQARHTLDHRAAEILALLDDL